MLFLTVQLPARKQRHKHKHCPSRINSVCIHNQQVVGLRFKELEIQRYML